jgi:hypothetical protein
MIARAEKIIVVGDEVIGSAELAAQAAARARAATKTVADVTAAVGGARRQTLARPPTDFSGSESGWFDVFLASVSWVLIEFLLAGVS